MSQSLLNQVNVSNRKRPEGRITIWIRSQSLLNQVNVSNGEGKSTMKKRVESQSLLNQVNVSNAETLDVIKTYI